MKVEEPIADYAKLDLGGTYSYLDYLRWQFKERVELIRGKVRKMSPAPNTSHQTISSNIGRDFLVYFQKTACKVFMAPFDVRLPILQPAKNYTVVQPDLCVVCDESKLDTRGCDGAPDLVIEILSPGNSSYEMQTKFSLYEESGVKEYWIVDPDKKVIFVYELRAGIFVGLRPFIENDVVDCRLFPNLRVDVRDVFFGLK